MHVSFTATHVYLESEEYALIIALEGSDRSLILQRDSEGNFEDAGLYLEFGGQHNGDYVDPSSWSLSRKAFQINLSQQLGALEGVTGFDIELEIDDTAYELMLDVLPRIFRDAVVD